MFAFVSSLENVSAQTKRCMRSCKWICALVTQWVHWWCCTCMLSTYIRFTKKPPRQLLSIKLKKFNLISSWNRHESEKSTWVCVLFCQFCLRLYSWLLHQECPKFCRSQGNYNISNNIKQDSHKHSFSYSFYSSAAMKRVTF